jgi:Arc/MetJ family transcription regulator
MRITITVDDNLLAQAQAYTGLKKKSAVIQEALKALIQREAARRSSLLGGTQPDLVAPPRRRQDPAAWFDDGGQADLTAYLPR